MLIPEGPKSLSSPGAMPQTPFFTDVAIYSFICAWAPYPRQTLSYLLRVDLQLANVDYMFAIVCGMYEAERCDPPQSPFS